MSRSTVRGAIAAFFTPATVTGLATIHEYPQSITNEGDFDLPGGAGQGLGGIIFVHLINQKEKRIGLGGPTSGIKWRQYEAVLICLYRSNDPKAEVAGAAADAFLDAIVARIQSDRKLGSPNVVFQGGEGSDTGGDDIEVDCSLPRILKGKGGGGGLKQVFATVKFTVAEMMYS